MESCDVDNQNRALLLSDGLLAVTGWFSGTNLLIIPDYTVQLVTQMESMREENERQLAEYAANMKSDTKSRNGSSYTHFESLKTFTERTESHYCYDSSKGMNAAISSAASKLTYFSYSTW